MASASTGSAFSLAVGQAVSGLRLWSRRQVRAAVVVAVAMAVVVGFVTVLIPNSLFARDIEPVWWNYPVWLITSALTGMLAATYVRAEPRTMHEPTSDEDADIPPWRRESRMGMAGGVLAWFAVGCPVCNKIALLAFGYTGALTWFAPIQPFLALGALVLTSVALLYRLRGQVVCPVPQTA